MQNHQIVVARIQLLGCAQHLIEHIITGIKFRQMRIRIQIDAEVRTTQQCTAGKIHQGIAHLGCAFVEP